MINTIENFPLPDPPVCNSNNIVNIKPIVNTKKIGIDFFPPNKASLEIMSPPIPLKNITRNLRYDIANIPDTFTWKTGEYDIMEPPDQGVCGSCWAVATTSVLSDRFAIKYKIKNPLLSAANTVSCASTSDYTVGCQDGGLPYNAGIFFETKGVKTDKCWPYNFGNQPVESSPCLSNLKEGCCSTCCSQGSTDSLDSADFWNKYYAVQGSTQNLYVVGNISILNYPATTLAVQKEIMTNGPVVGTFTCYKDFQEYWMNYASKGSIYIHDSTKTDDPGGHAVVIVGWGVGTDPRDSTKTIRYWQVRNSWGNSGDNGYCKMAFSADIPEESRVGLDIPYSFEVFPGIKKLWAGVTTFLPGLLPGLQPPEIQSPVSTATIGIIITVCALVIIGFFIFFYFK